MYISPQRVSHVLPVRANRDSSAKAGEGEGENFHPREPLSSRQRGVSGRRGARYPVDSTVRAPAMIRINLGCFGEALKGRRGTNELELDYGEIVQERIIPRTCERSRTNGLNKTERVEIRETRLTSRDEALKEREPRSLGMLFHTTLLLRYFKIC